MNQEYCIIKTAEICTKRTRWRQQRWTSINLGHSGSLAWSQYTSTPSILLVLNAVLVSGTGRTLDILDQFNKQLCLWVATIVFHFTGKMPIYGINISDIYIL